MAEVALEPNVPGLEPGKRQITTRDRLTFTLFAAASLHAALILGVSFDVEDLPTPSPTIEVTLATHNDGEVPEDADFIADANQLGSGTESEVLEKTTLEESELQANEFKETVPDPAAAVAETILEERELLATEEKMLDRVNITEVEAQEEFDSLGLNTNRTLQTLAQEIASLEARIAKEQQALSKAPRIRRLTSASTKSAAEAAYLNMWRTKVERIGTANYPGGSGSGSIRMLVVIKQDGTLKEVRILESSGNRKLDNAALRSVRLAAPYQQFSVQMRKNYEELEVYRTWEFSKGGNSLGS